MPPPPINVRNALKGTPRRRDPLVDVQLVRGGVEREAYVLISDLKQLQFQIPEIDLEFPKFQVIF